jgi:hypothetical protein
MKKFYILEVQKDSPNPVDIVETQTPLTQAGVKKQAGEEAIWYDPDIRNMGVVKY